MYMEGSSTDKDFSFYLKVHATYHRLDFFLRSQVGMTLEALFGLAMPQCFWNLLYQVALQQNGHRDYITIYLKMRYACPKFGKGS